MSMCKIYFNENYKEINMINSCGYVQQSNLIINRPINNLLEFNHLSLREPKSLTTRACVRCRIEDAVWNKCYHCKLESTFYCTHCFWKLHSCR